MKSSRISRINQGYPDLLGLAQSCSGLSRVIPLWGVFNKNGGVNGHYLKNAAYYIGSQGSRCAGDNSNDLTQS